MKEIVIFGIDRFAELIYNFLKEDEQYKVCGFCVDREYMNSDTAFGLPIVAFEEVDRHFPPDKYGMMICMGYTKMNTIRELKYTQAEKKGYRILGYRHPSAIVLSEDIDETNIIMEGVVIGQQCKIGRGNVFWPMAHVAHHTAIGSYNFFTISCSVAGNIKIGNNCTFGNNCTIKNGIKIEDYALIGAGAYISHDIEAESVYVPPRSYRLEGKKSWDFEL